MLIFGLGRYSSIEFTMKRTVLLFLCGCILCLACPAHAKSRPITPEMILEDLRSPRVKDVIIDSDTDNEMDDQYAIAYAIASEKMRVLALHAAPFYDADNGRSTSFANGMELSYEEMERVLDVLGCRGKYPVFKGSEHSVSENPEGFNPDNPAARNLVRIARKARKPVYVLCLGMITNVAAALRLDPSIKDKIVVVWLGTHSFSKKRLDEFNLRQDYMAGQMVVNSGVPLVILPASGKRGEGTQVLLVRQEEVEGFPGEGRVADFFKTELPREFHNPIHDPWKHIFWDIAAPGLVAHPEVFRLRIIPAPVLTDNHDFAFDSTRHKIVWMDSLDPEPIRSDLFRCLSSLSE